MGGMGGWVKGSPRGRDIHRVNSLLCVAETNTTL